MGLEMSWAQVRPSIQAAATGLDRGEPGSCMGFGAWHWQVLQGLADGRQRGRDRGQLGQEVGKTHCAWGQLQADIKPQLGLWLPSGRTVTAWGRGAGEELQEEGPPAHPHASFPP